jgi:hypothetical protein
MIVIQPKAWRQRALFFRVGARHPSPRLVDSRPQRAEEAPREADVVERNSNPTCAGLYSRRDSFSGFGLASSVDPRRFKLGDEGLAGWIFLLHYRWLLLADARQPFLNQPREFFLASWTFGVALGHADRAVSASGGSAGRHSQRR